MLLPENIRRLFLAVAAPSETLILLEDLKCRIPHHKAWKWMRPKNLHLTIFFVGNIEIHDYEPILKEFREIVSSFSPFSLKFDGIAIMPSKKPYMLWAKFKKHERYTEMYHSIHKVLSPYLKNNSEIYSEPVPHITLARFHGSGQNNFTDINSGVILPEVYVDKIFIWETENKTGQSDYIQDVNGLPMNI